jgi:hypothetical protein
MASFMAVVELHRYGPEAAPSESCCLVTRMRTAVPRQQPLEPGVKQDVAQNYEGSPLEHRLNQSNAGLAANQRADRAGPKTTRTLVVCH